MRYQLKDWLINIDCLGVQYIKYPVKLRNYLKVTNGKLGIKKLNFEIFV
jgi:hypothetical protein